MPATLSAEAKREWRRIVPVIDAMGILTTVDRAVLVRYCTAWADWVELDAQIAKSSRLIQGRDGNLVRNPLWLLRRDAAAEVAALSVQLGLTPVARLRSNIKHEPPQKTVAPADPQVSDFVAERTRRLMEG